MSKEEIKVEDESSFDWDKEMTADDWIKDWDDKDTWAHNDIYEGLRNNIDKLTNGKPCRFFIPMCADMFDMKWLYDQGHTVIGVDIAEKPAKGFFTTHKIEHKVEDVKDYGRVYKSVDGRIVIYAGDVLTFNKELGGGDFDVIYDVGAMQALNKGQRSGYIDMEYGLLKQGGHLFVNLMGDKDIPDDAEKVPPHYQECYDKLVATFHVERVSRYKLVMEAHGKPEFMDADWCVINNFYMCTKK